ncbi:sulfatase [Paracidovorax citrulli]|nr:sulfatase [Paracidovorax citrulli]
MVFSLSWFVSRGHALLRSAWFSLVLVCLLALGLIVLGHDGKRVAQLVALAAPPFAWLFLPVRRAWVHRLRSALLWAWAMAFALDGVARAYLLDAYQAAPDSAMVLGAVANTNAREGAEYLRMHWRAALLAVSGVTAVAAVLAVCLARGLRSPQPPARERPRPPSRARRAALWGLGGAVMLPGAAAYASKPWRRLHPVLFWTQWGDKVEHVRADWAGQQGARQALLERARADAPSMAEDGPALVVLVISDSVNRDNMSLYGYARPTTPGLQAQQAGAGRGVHGLPPGLVGRCDHAARAAQFLPLRRTRCGTPPPCAGHRARGRLQGLVDEQSRRRGHRADARAHGGHHRDEQPHARPLRGVARRRSARWPGGSAGRSRAAQAARAASHGRAPALRPALPRGRQSLRRPAGCGGRDAGTRRPAGLAARPARGIRRGGALPRRHRLHRPAAYPRRRHAGRLPGLHVPLRPWTGSGARRQLGRAQPGHAGGLPHSRHRVAQRPCAAGPAGAGPASIARGLGGPYAGAVAAHRLEGLSCGPRCAQSGLPVVSARSGGPGGSVPRAGPAGTGPALTAGRRGKVSAGRVGPPPTPAGAMHA